MYFDLLGFFDYQIYPTINIQFPLLFIQPDTSFEMI